MGRFEKVVLASDNAGKLSEFSALLKDLDIELIAQRELGIGAAEETAITFIENALAKARHASDRSGLPALADDSGIVVAALNGEPGVRSARYAGEPSDAAANNRKLLEALQNRADRRAHFYCALVFVAHAADPAPIIATGSWFGSIAPALSGSGGFGYDPLFIPSGSRVTAAELPAAEKNRQSHRGQASARLVSQLRAACAE